MLMSFLLAAVLVPVHFTAPAETSGAGEVRGVIDPSRPAAAYHFYRLDGRGRTLPTPGYADSAARAILVPHAPGTRETAWISPGPGGEPVTVYLVSRSASGNLSSPSNGCVIRGASVPQALAMRRPGRTALEVPVIRQSRARCGQASLAMVLSFYGAAPAALREVDGAWDPMLRGSLITDLAGAARRAGFDAQVATLTPDSLIELLAEGVPPILLYQNGAGPLTVRHFGVVTGWDADRAAFTLHDGTARPRVSARGDLAKRWQTAGSQALIVRRRTP